MPNYSPIEETSLMALLASLRGGMEPTTGYQMFSDILNQQAARVDERQQKLASLQDLLAQQAQAGQTISGAQALADAYTNGPNVPPMIENTIEGLYPEQQQRYSAPISAPGNTPSEVGAGALAAQPIPQGPPGQQTSPAAPPVDPTAALQQKAAAYQAAQDIQEAQTGPPATVGDVVSGIYAAKAANASNDTILANIRQNPEAMEIVVKNYSALGKIFPGLFPDRSASQGGI